MRQQPITIHNYKLLRLSSSETKKNKICVLMNEHSINNRFEHKPIFFWHENRSNPRVFSPFNGRLELPGQGNVEPQAIVPQKHGVACTPVQVVAFSLESGLLHLERARPLHFVAHTQKDGNCIAGKRVPQALGECFEEVL